MNSIVLVSCLFAVASAGWIPIHNEYHGPQHHPVIHKGVPVDTPEVQHARAAHLAALAKESEHGSYHHEEHNDDHHHDDYHHEDYHHHEGQQNYGYSIHHAEPVVHHEVHHAPVEHHAVHQHIAPAYQTSHVVPAIGHDGKPLDTPEVEAAKAHHFAAFHEALSKVATHGVQHGAEHYYRKRRSIHEEHYPIIDKHGVPVEPLEVQHARAEHLAAHAAAEHSGYGIEHHDEYSHDEHETYSHPHIHEGHSDLHEGKHGYTLHQKHAPVYGVKDIHDYHIPKYDYHGHPLDTDEVEHLKALHFAAHAKALHHY